MKKATQVYTDSFHFKLIGQIVFCVFLSIFSTGQTRVADTTSYIQTVEVETGKIDTILVANGDFEAPNWHPDNYLVMNFRGRMYKLDLATKALSVINTGPVNRLMDDHGI